MVAVTLWLSNGGNLAGNYGDTDDALRLVIVRDLLSGRAGWYDQHMMRLQPPVGMDLHWSRLIDGGLAGLQSLLRLALPPGRAELAMRALWPLIWIFPAAAATISIARRLRGDAAALLCAAMLAMDLLLYAQWVPGRIDHHNVQIALALVALAGAMGGGWRGALVAGLATGLGLAVGLEALIFYAVVGAGVALWFLAAPAQQARSVQAYAVGLLVTAAPLFFVETPPARWTLSVCDTIGANLVSGLAVAAVGLLAWVALTARRAAWVRFAGLGVVAALAGGTYLRMDVTCLHGPLAEADPRIWPIWLSHVNEMLPLSHGLADLTNAVSWGQAILIVLGAAAWLWLGRRREARTAGWLMAGAWLALAAAAGVAAARMAHYPALIATALLAAAAADLAARYARGRLVPALLLAVVLTPTWPTSILTIVGERLTRPYPKAAGAACKTRKAYAPLAAQPVGLVLGEIDLGPDALVTTSHAVLSAPYHRMGWGILAAHEILAAAPGADEAAARRLHVDYVINCPAHANVITHADLRPISLQRRLDRGQVPAWLRPLAPAAAPLQIYAVRPRVAAAG
ncbi:MAG: hypothetical protein JWR43_456 [Phenylobacterium sp.]|nr:hypothetical protein [Phenylobacterium sp.]